MNVPSWVGDPREDLLERLNSKEIFTTPLTCPLITHWLHNMTHDQVLDMLKYLGMGNNPEDKVKVIFVPCYLDGFDGIINKHYYDVDYDAALTYTVRSIPTTYFIDANGSIVSYGSKTVRQQHG